MHNSKTDSIQCGQSLHNKPKVDHRTKGYDETIPALNTPQTLSGKGSNSDDTSTSLEINSPCPSMTSSADGLIESVFGDCVVEDLDIDTNLPCSHSETDNESGYCDDINA